MGDAAVRRALGLYNEEKARREALEGGQGLSLGGWLGVAGGILGALGAGLLIGWVWGHLQVPGGQVPAPPQGQLERGLRVLLTQP